MRNSSWRDVCPIGSMEKKMIIGAIGAEAADGLMLEFLSSADGWQDNILTDKYIIISIQPGSF